MALDWQVNWSNIGQVFGVTVDSAVPMILLGLGMLWIGYSRLLPARMIPASVEFAKSSFGQPHQIYGLLQLALGWGLAVWVVAVTLFVSLWIEGFGQNWIGILLNCVVAGFILLRVVEMLFFLQAEPWMRSAKGQFGFVLLVALLIGNLWQSPHPIFWWLFYGVILNGVLKVLMSLPYQFQLKADCQTLLSVFMPKPQRGLSPELELLGLKYFLNPKAFQGWIMVVLIASVLWVLGCVMVYFLQTPHGGWDATMIWNLHAKLLASGGEEWHRLFDRRWPWWNENHYPPLLSAVVAAGWYVSGSFSPWFPFFIAVGFGLSTLGALYGFVSRLKNHWVGLGAVLVLLATPYYWEILAQQLADVPFGYFLLCVVGSLVMGSRIEPKSNLEQSVDELDLQKQNRKALLQVRYQWILLSGCFAGLVLLTKQEGVLLIISCLMAWGLMFLSKRVLVKRKLPWVLTQGLLVMWLVGLVPALLMWGWYRSQMVGVKDIYFSQPWERMLLCLTDLHRYEVIWRKFVQDCFTGFSGPLGLFWFGVLWALFPKDWRPWQTGAFRFGLLVLVILGLLYTLTYLLTPYPLEWQLYFSARRLWIHLWPTMILLTSWLIDWPEPESDVIKDKDVQAL
jgi:hypothetical protein